MGQQANTVILKIVILSYFHFILQASTKSLNCTFDAGFCDWTSDKDDHFDWKRVKGTYLSSGPASDHTTGDGLYIYIDATYQQKGERARIISPVQTPGVHCLTLWYNMNSRNLGALNIYVKTANGRETLIFTKDTSIRSFSWQKAVISHKTNVKFQVVLEGVRGWSFLSDIAVDDISMTDGMCAGDCNFESGFCDWVQDLSDDFDWSRHRGGTSTPNTGPQGDHTSGRGYYIYIDTSETSSNYNARILSPWLREGKYCFSFWYNMHGEDVETLTVQTGDVNQNKIAIIQITRDQRQQWIQENAFIHATSGFQIIIEGTVKNSWWNHDYGDIAIDDVRILSCQDCADPTPRYGKTNSSSFPYISIVQIMCNLGYSIKGDHIIVCNSEGIWSGSPTCEPVDCSIPKIANGIMSGLRNNTTYNQTVDIACEDGYDLVGNKSITCQADGYWSDPPTCVLLDCLIPKIANGIMSGPRNNTTYNQTVDIACKDGYDLIGNKSITCQADGYWSALPTCDLRDVSECNNPIPENGILNSTRFRYGSAIQITCNDGYRISGKPVIYCQANGNWTSSPTCRLIESKKSSDVSFVYVMLPLVAVALVISVTAIVCRKKILRYFAIRGPPGNVKKEHFYENQSHQHVDLSQDDGNVVIADESHELGLGKTIEFSTIADAAITTEIEIQHSYNTMETNRVQVVDNVMEQTKGETKECNHRYEQLVGETSEFYILGPQSVDEKHYSVLMTDENEIKANDGATHNEYEQPVEYYSLGPESVDEKHYSVLMRDDNDKKANDGATDIEYEQPVGATPEYFVFSPLCDGHYPTLM